MNKQLKSSLTDAQQIMLGKVLDRLIPAIDEIPSAGQMGLVQHIEQTALRFERFWQALTRVLDAISLDPHAHAQGGFSALEPETQDEAIEEVENGLSSEFESFLELVYYVYYSDSRVHKRIGWRSGPLQPKGFDMPPFDEAILETVRTRKPFWREA